MYREHIFVIDTHVKMGDIPRYYSKYLLPACIYCTASAAIAAILEVLQIYISCYKLTYERMPD